MKVKDIKAMERFINTMNIDRIGLGYFISNKNEIVLMNDYSMIIYNNITENDKTQIMESIKKSNSIFDADKIINTMTKDEYKEETKEVINIADLEIVKQIKRENKLGRNLCTTLEILQHHQDLIYKNNNVWTNKEMLMIIANCLGGKQIEVMNTRDKLRPSKIVGEYGVAYIMPINYKEDEED